MLISHLPKTFYTLNPLLYNHVEKDNLRKELVSTRNSFDDTFPLSHHIYYVAETLSQRR